MRPVTGSIRVNPACGDPDGSEADGQAAFAGVLLKVDRGDDLARVRIDADGLRQPVDPRSSAIQTSSPSLATQPSSGTTQPDLVGRGIDPHHLSPCCRRPPRHPRVPPS